ncbi:MAG: copper(I)-binding protein [Lentimonas sp.]|jgi:copper(I)-binding protein
MIRAVAVAVILSCATSATAQGITISEANVPLAPPGARAHAAYLTLSNTGSENRSLIGVTAQGYGMAHLHQSTEQSGVAVMSTVHQLEIAAGQTVALTPGNLHIMLMQPASSQVVGASVPLTLHFANGKDITTQATITQRDGGS